MKLNRPPLVPSDAPPSLLKAARRTFRAGLLLGVISAVQAAHAQALYAITENASPSETLSVRGDGLANDTTTTFKVYPYSPSGTRGDAVSCVPDSANGMVAMFTLPSTITDSVYEVVGSTSKGTTNSLFVNRARMEWSDVPEAMPDGAVRVIGRNFKPRPGLTPTVTLTDSATGIAYNATLQSVTDNCVTFVVPSNAPADPYKISVNNNLAGPASADPNTLALTVKTKAPDPFNLGVSWGADFNAIAANVFNAKTDPRLWAHLVGDGTTTEGQALAVALYSIERQGGGTLYLPAGTYRIDDGVSSVSLPPNVVLKGAGKGQTILQIGYNYTPTHAPTNFMPIYFYGGNGGNNGISDLTIENLNANASPSNVMAGGPVGTTTNKLFLKNVAFKINNGRTLSLNIPRKAVIADCDFISTTTACGPIFMNDVRELQFVRNTVDYRAGRCAFAFGQRCVLDGNTIQFNNAYHTPTSGETGGLELSYGQQILVQNNNLGGYNGLGTKITVDGEVLGTQLSNINEFSFVGTVKSISGKLLVPKTNWSTAAWQSATYGPLARKYVMIVSGKGAGQWRWITANSTSWLMVDRNWQITPDSTSRYEIMSMNNYQQTWADNNIYGGYNGATIYDGAFDSVIARNVLTNTGQLIVRTSCIDTSGNAGSNYAVGAAWDVSVTDNVVTDTIGYMPATIVVAAIDSTSSAFGPMIMNVDVRRNTIVGCYLTRPYETGRADGIEVSTIYYNGNNLDTTDNLGTIVQSNTVTGSNYPVRVTAVSLGNLFDNMIRATGT